MILKPLSNFDFNSYSLFILIVCCCVSLSHQQAYDFSRGFLPLKGCWIDKDNTQKEYYLNGNLTAYNFELTDCKCLLLLWY